MKTAEATNRLIYTYAVPIHILTGNDVISYFWSAANRINMFILVMFGSQFLDNVSTGFEMVDSIGKADSRASFPVMYQLDIVLLDIENGLK